MQKPWQAVLAHVRGALMRRGRTAHDADDLVQEAWLRMARYQSAQVVEQPEAFLMRTALNLSVDVYRTRASQGEEVMLEDVVLVDTAPSVEAQALARERVARLGVCLSHLNERTRVIFLAHRLDGLSYQEIGRQQGLCVSSVERHIAKATLQVTKWMEGW